MTTPSDILIYATPDHDGDLFYASKFKAGDPLFFARVSGRSHLILSDLELDRAKRTAKVDNCVSLSALVEAVKSAGESPTPAAIAAHFLRSQNCNAVRVPATFPVAIADALRERGLNLTVEPALLFPERAIKREDEIDAIRSAIRSVERTMDKVVAFLGSVRVDDKGHLVDGGEIITSEFMHAFIAKSLLDERQVATDIIVACGDQGVDPHERGYGPLFANQTLIFDIFGRAKQSYYWSDFTRTVIVGKASPEQHALYDAVREGQDYGLDNLAAGKNGRDIHEGIQKIFERRGFKTGLKDGRMQGFFHGTGHGLGVEIHESPRVSSVNHVMQAGEVVTVEPGLYYAGLGGVRLEDVVVIRDGHAENLTNYPRVLEI